MKSTLSFFLILTVLSACSSSGSRFSDKPERTVTIEIFSSDVIKLDGKDIHISFFENQIEKMAVDSELKADVKIHSNANVDAIRTTQQILRKFSSDIVYDSDSAARVSN